MALSLVTMRDFHGPDFWSYQYVTLHSDPMLRHAHACSLNLHAHAGGPWCNKVRAKHNHARGWCCCSWNLELTCRLLWASFQFKPRSWTSSVLLRNFCARTWTHAAFERWIGENWAEPLLFERATWSDPKFGITFGAGQDKTLVYNGGTSSNLMSPPSTEAPVESCWPDGSDAGAWASVATRRSCSCACLSISPPCVCVGGGGGCCSLSAVFRLDSVKVDNQDMVVHTLSLLAPDVWQLTFNLVRETAVLFVHRIFEYSFV